MTRADYLDLAAMFLCKARDESDRPITTAEKDSLADCREILEVIRLQDREKFDSHGMYFSTH